MTSDTFNELLANRIRSIESVLASKSAEYATGSDKLHNFKRAAAMLNCTPARACMGFLAKHLVSILDIVGGVPAGEAMIDEKIGDAINYLVLLEAILKEK